MSESMLMSCEFSKWWLDRDKMMVVFVLFMAMFLPFARGDDPQLLQTPPHQTNFQWALMNISYVDYATKKEYSKPLRGYFGKQSLIASISGVVIHAVNVEDRAGTQVVNHYGCTPYSHKKFPSETWIALVERGSCSFANKIHVATKEHNASAIVIYNDVSVTNGPIIMDHDKAPGSIAVMLLREEGQEIVGFIEKGYTVYMQMKPGSIDSFTTPMQNNISKTSVLFVSISFVVLMVVSLAWLIFYYVQRFRYSHAKERLARRLTCAAKKAITKIPQRTLKTGDKELDSEYDPCAICIESYKFHEVIRILPCRHVFHKSCVDPWLLDQRSCPMCKLDILRAYGMQVGGSQESLHPAAETGRVVAPNPEEPELNSSIEYNHPNEATIMLVSDTCLHFCGGTSERTDDNEKVDKDSRGAVGGIHKSSSLSSLSSKGSSHTRAEKTDKAGSVNSEKRALIKKEPEEKRSWKSEDVFSSPDDSDGKKIGKDAEICVARIELEMGDVEKRETSQPYFCGSTE